MILHILSKSPFTHSAFSDALPFFDHQDKIILIDDGVYAGIDKTLFANKIIENKCQCFALADDIKTRGLANIHSSIQAIEMSDFVTLTFAADKNITWS